MDWVKRNLDYTLTDGKSGFSISFAGMDFSSASLESLNDKFARAIKGIADIENGMIKNPDIKMIAVDGVAPTVENIKSGAYPIIAPVYAVTYEGNDNPNVQRLLDWILSDEGQYIIEKTGYVGN